LSRHRIVLASIIAAAFLCVLAAITAIGTALIERAYPATGQFVEVAGGRLHLVELAPRGTLADRPAIILIHGAGANLNDMRVALGERLSERYRVVLIDRPGHGWSERTAKPEGASPASQAAMVHEALGRLGIKPVILVGHSWGGAVAAAYALDHPQNVAGLVLLAPVTHPWVGGTTWYYELGATPFIGPFFAHTFALPAGWLMVGMAVQAVFFPLPAPADYVDRAAGWLGLRPQEFLANAEEVAGLKAFVTGQAARYRELTVPTVIITGNRDTTVSPRIHSYALEAAVPGSQLIVLPGVGHMPHYAAPDRIVTAISEIAEGRTKKKEAASFGSRVAFAPGADESDPQHVGRARGSERHPGHDDDALAGFGKTFPERDATSALNHVVLVPRVLSHDAMNAPYQ
jgi:pimeloyl-ACP methyl ester carboxylesterase